MSIFYVLEDLVGSKKIVNGPFDSFNDAKTFIESKNDLFSKYKCKRKNGVYRYISKKNLGGIIKIQEINNGNVIKTYSEFPII